jgi:CDP-diacylglycerol--glycerol-3-phosphate 3-phosphatidyltransferase
MKEFLHKLFSHPSLPNFLTFGRILSVVVIVLGVALGKNGPYISKVIALFYLVASLSDLLDGYLARKYKNESNLGRFLDPLADKLLVFSALIMLIPNLVPAWVAFLIITRELSVTSLRAIAMERGLVISASKEGKMKTFAQNIALFCLLWNGRLLWCDTVDVGIVILYVALFITYWSGILYFYNFYIAMIRASKTSNVLNSSPNALAKNNQADEISKDLLTKKHLDHFIQIPSPKPISTPNPPENRENNISSPLGGIKAVNPISPDLSKFLLTYRHPRKYNIKPPFSFSKKHREVLVRTKSFSKQLKREEKIFTKFNKT